MKKTFNIGDLIVEERNNNKKLYYIANIDMQGFFEIHLKRWDPITYTWIESQVSIIELQGHINREKTNYPKSEYTIITEHYPVEE